MATVDQVAEIVRSTVETILATAGDTIPPNQVGVGKPFAPAISEILGEGEAQVTIYPMTQASQNRTSRKPFWTVITQQVVTLVAAFSQDGSNILLTFSGTVAAGFNIHVFPGSNTDAYYKTLVDDTLDDVATAVAAAINALDLDGVSATPAGATVSVAGTSRLGIGIGGSAMLGQEVRRTMMPVQVSVWAPDANSRQIMGALLENNLGVDFPIPFLQAADGSAVWIRMRGAPDWHDDTSQRSYSLYEWHGVFECEYITMQTTVATQIESVGVTFNNGSVQYAGGTIQWSSTLDETVSIVFPPVIDFPDPRIGD